MSQSYDVVFRERAVAAYNSGEGGYHTLARAFGIGYRTLQRWVAQERSTGTVAPRTNGGGWTSPIDVTVLERMVREVPDATVAEVCRAYNRHVPAAQRTTRTSVGRALRRLGYVRKKNGRARVSWIVPMSRRSASPSAAGSVDRTRSA